MSDQKRTHMMQATEIRNQKGKENLKGLAGKSPDFLLAMVAFLSPLNNSRNPKTTYIHYIFQTKHFKS